MSKFRQVSIRTRLAEGIRNGYNDMDVVVIISKELHKRYYTYHEFVFDFQNAISPELLNFFSITKSST